MQGSASFHIIAVERKLLKKRDFIQEQISPNHSLLVGEGRQETSLNCICRIVDRYINIFAMGN